MRIFGYILINFTMQKSIVRILAPLFFPVFAFSQSPQDSVAVMLFAGDVTLADRFEQALGSRTGNLFSRWNKIGSYDAMMVNLENAVTRSIDSVEKEYVFRMRPEYLSLFDKGKITLVNCANNHTADFGTEGILETIRLLDSAGIRHVGIGRTIAEARKPVILALNGIRIGFLGYGGVSAFLASRAQPGTTPRSRRIILSDIAKLRPRVNFVVVNLHWGEELAEQPDSAQIALAHAIIDAGADLVIGHHPHILQGIEYYRGKMIAYSLGNFIFGGNAKSANCITAILKSRFTPASVESQLVPIRIRNWRPEPADSAAALRVLQLVEERSKMFADTLLQSRPESSKEHRR
jgi:poly-gamma-glutamate capsule biosynthesis protein CapA/YwtB (metallophosphatase superfamily)